MKFRKRPVIIDAWQFVAEGESPLGVYTEEDGRSYVVTIHEQKCYVVPGDWIVPEPDGTHYYPVKDEIFRANYEEVKW